LKWLASEVAGFGKDVHEVYWASQPSTTSFKVPREKSGVLIGSDVIKLEMKAIAKMLSDFGFKLSLS